MSFSVTCDNELSAPISAVRTAKPPFESRKSGETAESRMRATKFVTPSS